MVDESVSRDRSLHYYYYKKKEIFNRLNLNYHITTKMLHILY